MRKTIVERRNKWIGHLVRNDTRTTTIVEGKLEGKPVRIWLRQLCIKQIMLGTGKGSCRESNEVTLDREARKIGSSFRQSTDWKKKIVISIVIIRDVIVLESYDFRHNGPYCTRKPRKNYVLNLWLSATLPPVRGNICAPSVSHWLQHTVVST